jgi:hypothetical protein
MEKLSRSHGTEINRDAVIGYLLLAFEKPLEKDKMIRLDDLFGLGKSTPEAEREDKEEKRDDTVALKRLARKWGCDGETFVKVEESVKTLSTIAEERKALESSDKPYREVTAALSELTAKENAAMAAVVTAGAVMAWPGNPLMQSVSEMAKDNFVAKDFENFYKEHQHELEGDGILDKIGDAISDAITGVADGICNVIDGLTDAVIDLT